MPAADDLTPSNDADEIERVASWLEKITRDPMADAVVGSVEVAAATSPSRRGRYQECTLELLVRAPGIPQRRVTYAAVFPRDVWPRVGDVLPARISTADPNAIEVAWERLSLRGE